LEGGMMQLANSTARYGAIAQALHWLTALFVVMGWLLGQFGDDLPKGARAAGLFIHMTLGLSVLAFLLLRLVWRRLTPPPAAEQTRYGRVVHVAANVSHAALYVLLIAVPAAGITLQFARGHAVPLFGVWAIPSPWVADRAFAHKVGEAHELLANALLILAALHMVAALWHHWVLRDRTLTRMLPRGT
jgi:cytochrome b561